MIYSIQNQFLKLTVCSVGAEKQALVSSKVNYLRKKDQFWDRVSPFLFPNVGKVRDMYTFIEGKRFELPQHGFLRDQEFEILQQKDDEIAFVNVFNDETLIQYPFKYKVIVKYKLQDLTLSTDIIISNEDNKVMPFNFGGHPGFTCPLYESEQFSDYRITFEKKETFNAPSVENNGTLNFNSTTKFQNIKDLHLDYKHFETDAIVIPRVKSREVYLLNKKDQGLKFSYPSFITLAIWTRPQAPFVCLEPWVGYADRHDGNHQFMQKDNIINLKPLEEMHFNYDITIIE